MDKTAEYNLTPAPVLERTPSASTLSAASVLARECDMPIMMDYWVMSICNNVFIGQRALRDTENEKIIIKNSEECTRPIARFVKPDKNVNEYIIMTENSIYVVFFENIQNSVKQIKA